MTAEQLYQRLRNVRIGGTVCQYSLRKCEELVPLINEINSLKREKNAVILVHSYVSPEIIYGVGDFVGDSYGLSKNAMETDADIIVFAAVRFMGETAKILNPDKEVLVPGMDSDCSLAESITAEEVCRLRKKHPDYTFLCYVNTNADVKAECDVCVTSSNVYTITKNVPNEKIYFLPDKLMGQNLAEEMDRRGVKKDIQYYDGTCYVHEEYNEDQIFQVRTEYPEARILSHPECNTAVTRNSDFVGSTSQMLDYMKTSKASQYLMLTECGLSGRLQVEHPGKTFVGSCALCRFMKSNTLEGILRVLKNPEPKDRIIIEKPVRRKALRSLELMFKYSGSQNRTEMKEE